MAGLSDLYPQEQLTHAGPGLWSVEAPPPLPESRDGLASLTPAKKKTGLLVVAGLAAIEITEGS